MSADNSRKDEKKAGTCENVCWVFRRMAWTLYKQVFKNNRVCSGVEIGYISMGIPSLEFINHICTDCWKNIWMCVYVEGNWKFPIMGSHYAD